MWTQGVGSLVPPQIKTVYLNTLRHQRPRDQDGIPNEAKGKSCRVSGAHGGFGSWALHPRLTSLQQIVSGISTGSSGPSWFPCPCKWQHL